MEVQPLSPETIQDTTLPPSSSDTIPAPHIDPTFSARTTDLISAPLGGRILSFSDEFFASASNLLSPHPPVRKPGVFVATGAWYDGWETRRHNPNPPDWVVVRLGPAAGKVVGVEIDTTHFSGNHAEEVEVWGTREVGEGADGVVMGEGYAGWKRVLGRRGCGSNRRQAWVVREGEKEIGEVTHVKLCMFPDGGIARFRLYGHAVPVWPADKNEEVELSAATMGGVVTGWSDQHFGKKDNLLLPGRGENMGDGWETKRSRGKGHTDWVVVRLGARGVVRRVVADTLHFRGNFPQGFRVEGLDIGDGEVEGEVKAEDERWVEIVGVQRCERDKEHVFEEGGLLRAEGRVFSHVKMIIIPDGGVKRFRVFGTRV
ncbi:Allantoicase [Lecanora helva]